VNPANNKNLIAVWQQDRWGAGLSQAQGTGVAVSFDGGKTWTDKTNQVPVTTCQGNPGGGITSSDPWVEFSSDGSIAYIQVLASVAGINRILLSKSLDGGNTWSVPTASGTVPGSGGYDKNSLTTDPRPGHENIVYAVWNGNPNQTGFFSKSIDRGNSWSPRIVIPSLLPTTPFTVSHELVVIDDGTPNGLLVVSFFTFNSTNAVVAVSRSTDGGTTWSATPTVAINVVAQTIFRPTNVFFIQGAPVDIERQVPSRAGSGIPDIAVNHKNGYLYIVVNDARFNPTGAIGAIITMSKDGGLTWSAPVPVNPCTLSVQAFMPTVAVDKCGRVGVLFYDFRNDIGGDSTLDTDVWLAIFNADLTERLAEIRLTKSSFDYRQFLIADNLGYFPGDYVQLVTDSSGKFEGVFTIANNLGLPAQAYPPGIASLTITTPAGSVGTYPAGAPSSTPPFGPAPSLSGLSGTIVAAIPLDASTVPANVSGKIALIQRGGPSFAQKVANAQAGGAIGVIIFNNVADDNIINMTGSSPVSTIPSIFISGNNGNKILANIASTTLGTMTGLNTVSLDNRQDIQFFSVKPELSKCNNGCDCALSHDLNFFRNFSTAATALPSKAMAETTRATGTFRWLANKETEPAAL